jgi:alpha-galactosidase
MGPSRFSALLIAGLFLSQVNGMSRRGWNSWDSSCAHDPAGNSDEARTLSVAAYMRDYLAPSGYNLLTVDEGWYWYGGQQSTNASLDGNGLPSPRLDQYPSAANGAGFGPLAATLQGTYGLDLGVWTIRGIPRAAAAARLPIAGSSYTCDQAVDVQKPNSCSWDGYCYGCAVNASTGRCVDAAVAYYKSLAALYKRWGIRFVKVDCMWGGPTQGSYDADVIAFTEAFRDEGGIEISMSPGGGVSAQNISYLAANRLAVQTRVTDGSCSTAGALGIHLGCPRDHSLTYSPIPPRPHSPTLTHLRAR